QAWAEHDYDTRLLHSNIAFPLLKELASAGDDKAARVIDAEIESRIREGNTTTKIAIIESFGDRLRNPELLASLLDDDLLVETSILNVLDGVSEDSITAMIIDLIDALVNKGSEAARRIQEKLLANLPHYNRLTLALELLQKWGDKVTDTGLLMATLNQILENHQNDLDSYGMLCLLLKRLKETDKYAFIKGATKCCMNGNDYIRETGDEYLKEYLCDRGVVLLERLTMKSYEPYIIDELLADPDPAVATIAENWIKEWNDRNLARAIRYIDLHKDRLGSNGDHEYQLEALRLVIEFIKTSRRHERWPDWFVESENAPMQMDFIKKERLCREMTDILHAYYNPRLDPGIGTLIKKWKMVIGDVP
nr:hypothetical protein [Candidatus Sigynarchaeota archaeon]